MTRQMADDEVLRVLASVASDYRRSAEQMVGDEWTDLKANEIAKADIVAEARAAVAALQAERDALRDDNARLGTAHDVVDASARRVRERAERAESALEALRGQVEGLVGGLRTQADRAEQRSEQKFAEGVADIAAQESGCAMTARHCAAHLDALLAIENSDESSKEK